MPSKAGSGGGAEDTHEIEASATFTRGRSRSSFSLLFSSCSRRSFRSAMDCFLDLASPPSRTAYAAGIVFESLDAAGIGEIVGS
jgi:hypothetical protein